MMLDRLDRTLDAVRLTFPLVDDRERAADILESALRELVARRAARPAATVIDALGAPLRPRLASPATIEWESLRQAVKLVIAQVGIETCAQRFGSSPDSLRDIINRTREPGVGRKARFLALVQSQANDDTGRFAHSASGAGRA